MTSTEARAYVAALCRGPWIPILAGIVGALGSSLFGLQWRTERLWSRPVLAWTLVSVGLSLVLTLVLLAMRSRKRPLFGLRGNPDDRGSEARQGCVGETIPRRYAPGLPVLIVSLFTVIVTSRPGPRNRVSGHETWSKLVELEVQGVADPGYRCRLRLYPSSRSSSVLFGGRAGCNPVFLSLPLEPCNWAQGDRIIVASKKLRDPAKAGSKPVWVSHYGYQRYRGFSLWRDLAQTRWRAFLQSRDRGVDNHGIAMVLSSVAGMRAALPLSARTNLRRAGLSHLSAISGLHVSVVACASAWWLRRVVLLLRWCRRRYRLVINALRGGISVQRPNPCLAGTKALRGRRGKGLQVAVMIPELFVFAASLMFVCAFVLATGGAISAIRAALLWSAGRLGACLGWSIGSLNALFWVAWLMILVAPHWVFEASFQMSVVATALILSRPDEDASSLKISWRLTWGLAPLTLVHFGEASFAGVLFNLVAIPLFTHWILPFGLLALLAGILGETAEIVALLDLAETILRVAGWGGNLLLELASWAQVFPDGKPRSWLCWMLGLQSIRTWLWASPKAIAPISTRFLRGLDGLLPFWGALFLLGVSALRVLWE